jgi:hypothetical protein
VLTQTRLADALAGFRVAPTHAVAEAAQRVATGDLVQAAALLPALGQPVLAQAYDSAFRVLLYILVAITLASAIMVLGFLGRASSDTATAEVN